MTREESPSMRSLSQPALELLKHYAGYHRDQRNIATHMVGVPLIVFGFGVLLARPALEIGVAGLSLTPAWALFAAAALWYLTRGLFTLGLAVTAGVGLLLALAHQVDGGVAGWLGWGLGCFGVGWLIQGVGHYYEGRKPAFADDLVGLLVGPMFVTLELLSAAGFYRDVTATIERHAGPTRIRDLAQPMTR